MDNQELCDQITSTKLDRDQIQKTYDLIIQYAKNDEDLRNKFEYLIVTLFSFG